MFPQDMLSAKNFLFSFLLIIPILTAVKSISIQSELDDNSLSNLDAPFSLNLNKRQTTDNNNRTRTNTTVCYDLLGCFDNNEPFNNAAFEVPQSPDFISTAFLLFTQEKPEDPEFISYNDTDDELIQSSVNPSRWLRIIIHGFTNNRDSVWIRPLRTELMKLTDDLESDVLVIDWGQGAKFPAYSNAVANTRVVGKQVGVLLDRLRTLKGLDFNKVHCIGHSLGAHTCGYASNAINNKMNRISGLDPAGPLFAAKRTVVRLDRDDADFVDVIHSNTEVALGLGLGIVEESGDIDFYVNGGQSQPGCPTVSQLVGGVVTGQSEAAYEQASCSHSRAHGYFIESINSDCPYTGFPCHDYNGFMNGKCLVCPDTGCAQMGFYSMYSIGRGKMYLTTKHNAPFCGYHYFVEMLFDQDMAKTAGDIYVGVFSDYELLENITITPKQNTEVKAGDVLRHVFSYRADLSSVSYLVVYFNKMKNFFGWGSQKANEIIITRLRLKSLEDSSVFSALCSKPLSIKAYTSETILMDRHDCYD